MFLLPISYVEKLRRAKSQEEEIERQRILEKQRHKKYVMELVYNDRNVGASRQVSISLEVDTLQEGYDQRKQIGNYVLKAGIDGENRYTIYDSCLYIYDEWKNWQEGKTLKPEKTYMEIPC